MITFAITDLIEVHNTLGRNLRIIPGKKVQASWELDLINSKTPRYMVRTISLTLASDVPD